MRFKLRLWILLVNSALIVCAGVAINSRMGEVNAAVAHVHRLTHRNALMVEQINNVARNVAEQARHLTGFVEGYVIEERQSASSAPPSPKAPSDFVYEPA